MQRISKPRLASVLVLALLALGAVPAAATALTASVQVSTDIVHSQAYVAVSFVIGESHFLTGFTISFPYGYVMSTASLGIVSQIGVPTGKLTVDSCPGGICTISYTFTNKQFVPVGRTVGLTFDGIQAPGAANRADAYESEYVTITTYDSTAIIEGPTLSSSFVLRQITGADIATSSNLLISSLALNCGSPTFASGNSTCLNVTGLTGLRGTTTAETILPADPVSMVSPYSLGSATDLWNYLYVDHFAIANLVLTGNPASITASTSGANLQLVTTGAGDILLQPGGSTVLTVSSSGLAVTGTVASTGTISSSASTAFKNSGGSFTVSSGGAITGASLALTGDISSSGNPFTISGSGNGVNLESVNEAGNTAQVNIVSGTDTTIIGFSGQIQLTTGNAPNSGSIVLTTGSSANPGAIQLNPDGSTELTVEHSSVQVQVTHNFSVGGTSLLTGAVTADSNIYANGGLVENQLGGLDLQALTGNNIQLSSGSTDLFQGSNTGQLTIQSGTNQNALVQSQGTGTLTLNSGAAPLSLQIGGTSEVIVGDNGLGFSTTTSLYPLYQENPIILAAYSTLPSTTGYNEIYMDSSNVVHINSVAAGAVDLDIAGSNVLSAQSGFVTITPVLYANGGISTTSGDLNLDSATGNIHIATGDYITGTYYIGGTPTIATSIGVLTDNSYSIGSSTHGLLNVFANDLTSTAGDLVLFTPLGDSISLNPNAGSGVLTVSATGSNVVVGSSGVLSLTSGASSDAYLNAASGQMVHIQINGADYAVADGTTDSFEVASGVFFNVGSEFTVNPSGIVSEYNGLGTYGMGVAPIYYEATLSLPGGTGTTEIGSPFSVPTTGLYVVNCAITTDGSWNGAGTQCKVTWTDNLGDGHAAVFGTSISGSGFSTFNNQATIYAKAGSSIDVYIYDGTTPSTAGNAYGIMTISALT